MCRCHADQRERPQVCVAARQSRNVKQLHEINVSTLKFITVVFVSDICELSSRRLRIKQFTPSTFVCFFWRNRLTISPVILLVDTYYTTHVDSKQPRYTNYLQQHLQTEGNWRLHPSCVYQAHGCSRRRQTLHELELRWWNFHWPILWTDPHHILYSSRFLHRVTWHFVLSLCRFAV